MSNLSKQILTENFQKEYMGRGRKKPPTINIDQILNRYNDGLSITDLAIAFGIKKVMIAQILLENGIKSKEAQSIVLLGKAADKRQLNIRLGPESYNLLEELTILISKKLQSTLVGNIEFSLPCTAEPYINKGTVAKILLENALVQFKKEIS